MSFFVINTNTQALYAQRSLFKNTRAVEKSVEKMSTGLRINRAGDDAAGLSIADKIKAEVQGLRKAKQNSLDGISMIETMDGGLQAVQENLFRIRELMVQGLSGTYGADELDALQREINERITGINDMVGAVQFNSQALLIGGTNKSVQTGAYANQTTSILITPGVAANTGIDIDITHDETGTTADYGQITEGVATGGLALNDIKLAGSTVANLSGETTTTAGSQGTLADMDTMIGNINRMRAHLGAVFNTLEVKIEFLDRHAENATAAESRIRDLDIAAESSNLIKNQILQQASTAMLAQANSMTELALNLIP